MSSKLRVNSFFIFVLAVLFYIFFMHCKHDPALSKANEFADDPYDAVGSFGIQAAAFLGILCLIRAFRSNPAAGSPVVQLRAQIAAVLSIAVTLLADGVAMLRHPALWIGSPAGHRLIALLGGMAVLTVTVAAPPFRAARRMQLAPAHRFPRMAALLSLVAILILFAYPQSIRYGLIGSLLTVLLGAAILFATMWVWTTALVPDQFDVSESERTAPGSRARRNYRWVLVILAGVLIGLFFAAGEASEGTGIPRSRLALVILVYLGLETAGIMIGYGFLATALGLFRAAPQ